MSPSIEHVVSSSFEPSSVLLVECESHFNKHVSEFDDDDDDDEDDDEHVRSGRQVLLMSW